MIGNAQLGRQIGVEWGVQAHLAALDRAQGHEPGEGLADRTHAEERAVRVHRSLAGHIREAITLLQHHLAVLDDGDRDACDVLARHGLADGAVHQRFKRRRRDRLIGRQQGWGGGTGGRRRRCTGEAAGRHEGEGHRGTRQAGPYRDHDLNFPTGGIYWSFNTVV